MADAAAGDPAALLSPEVTKDGAEGDPDVRLQQVAEGDPDVRLQQALDDASEQARLAKQASFAAAHSRAELDSVLEQNEELHRQVRSLEEELRGLRARQRRSRSGSDALAESPKGPSARARDDGRAELEPHRLLELLTAAEDARDLAARERDEALQALEETENAAARDGGDAAGLRRQLSEVQQQLAELQADRQELEQSLVREQDANAQLCRRVLEMEAILEAHRDRPETPPPADAGETQEFFIGSFFQEGHGPDLGRAVSWAAEADEAITGRTRVPAAAPVAAHPLARGPGEERKAPQPGAAVPPAPDPLAPLPELSAEPLWARPVAEDPLRARGGAAGEAGATAASGTFGPAQLDEVWRLFQPEGGRAPAEEHATGARREGRPDVPAVDILGSRDVEGTTWYLFRVAESDVDFFFLKRYSDFVSLDKALRASADHRRNAVRPQELPESGLFGLRHKLDLGGFNARRLQALRAYMETLLTQVNKLDDDPSLASFFKRDRCVRRVMR